MDASRRLASTYRLLVPLAILLCTGGCGAHVVIRLPSAHAPAEQRKQAYETYRLKSTSLSVDERTVYGPDNTRRTRRTSLYQGVLNDGTVVTYAEDLLPAVAPSSETARSLRRYRTARRTRNIVAFAGIGVALGLFCVGVADSDNFGTWAGVTGGALAATLIGYLVAGSVERNAQSAAFQTYNADLRQRLDLTREQH